MIRQTTRPECTLLVFGYFTFVHTYKWIKWILMWKVALHSHKLWDNWHFWKASGFIRWLEQKRPVRWGCEESSAWTTNNNMNKKIPSDFSTQTLKKENGARSSVWLNARLFLTLKCCHLCTQWGIFLEHCNGANHAVNLYLLFFLYPSIKSIATCYILLNVLRENPGARRNIN